MCQILSNFQLVWLQLHQRSKNFQCFAIQQGQLCIFFVQKLDIFKSLLTCYRISLWFSSIFSINSFGKPWIHSQIPSLTKNWTFWQQEFDYANVSGVSLWAFQNFFLHFSNTAAQQYLTPVFRTVRITLSRGHNLA